MTAEGRGREPALGGSGEADTLLLGIRAPHNGNWSLMAGTSLCMEVVSNAL